MFKSIVALLAGLSFAGAAMACTTHTYFVNGKMVTCTTCCVGGNCTTNCF
jgi:hypothetical protein